MRDLFDDFMEELRRREAAARGEDPGPPRRPTPPSDHDEGPADEPGTDADGGPEITDSSDPDIPDTPPSAETRDDEPPTPIDRSRRRRRRGRRPPGGPTDGDDLGDRAARAGRRFGMIFI